MPPKKKSVHGLVPNREQFVLINSVSTGNDVCESFLIPLTEMGDELQPVIEHVALASDAQGENNVCAVRDHDTDAAEHLCSPVLWRIALRIGAVFPADPDEAPRRAGEKAIAGRWRAYKSTGHAFGNLFAVINIRVDD